jgi:hypothetical protein
MPGTNALARAIAKALAKGQVKKAARIEADAVLRRELWKEFEREAVNEMTTGKAPKKVWEFLEDVPSYEAPMHAVATLRKYGYSQKQANKLTERLWARAYSDIRRAQEVSAGAKKPAIPPSGNDAEQVFHYRRMPEVRKYDTNDRASDFLLRQYPDAKLGTLVEHGGKIFMRRESLKAGSPGKKAPYWLQMEIYEPPAAELGP